MDEEIASASTDLKAARLSLEEQTRSTKFLEGRADAALAASVFHFNEINIQDLKKELRNNKIEVRL